LARWTVAHAELRHRNLGAAVHRKPGPRTDAPFPFALGCHAQRVPARQIETTVRRGSEQETSILGGILCVRVSKTLSVRVREVRFTATAQRFTSHPAARDATASSDPFFPSGLLADFGRLLGRLPWRASLYRRRLPSAWGLGAFFLAWLPGGRRGTESPGAMAAGGGRLATRVELRRSA